MKDYLSAYESTKLQAKIWKQEARCANDTIAKIYQLCTGAQGEPGTWNGVEPIRAILAERDALREQVRSANPDR